MTIAELKQRLDLYEKLMRLDKPIGTLLLLWPTLWALWIATEGQPHWMLAFLQQKYQQMIRLQNS